LPVIEGSVEVIVMVNELSAFLIRTANPSGVASSPIEFRVAFAVFEHSIGEIRQAGTLIVFLPLIKFTMFA
jgi:hypothetical protein